jgi:polyhydroxyalkanoate synthesis regulator phasin
MSLEDGQTETPATSGDVTAPVAESAAPQVATDGGSPSSGETVETRSPDQIVRDEFMAKFGPKPEPDAEPKPEPKAEAKAETPVETTDRQEDGPSNGRLSKEEFDALPERARNRIGELSSRLRDLTTEATQYRESHQQLEQIRDYTEKNNLSAEDVTSGLQIMALYTNGRMKEFVEAVRPFFDQARQALGEDIAPDLKALVDNGEMSAEAAQRLTKDLTTSRMTAQQAQARLQAAEVQQQAGTAAQAQARLLVEAKSAIAAEEAKFSSDPDWRLKQPEVQRQFQSMIGLLKEQGTLPKTPEQYARLVRTIYEGVKVVRPEPKPVVTTPRATSSATPAMAAPPKTPLEAVQRAILG